MGRRLSWSLMGVKAEEPKAEEPTEEEPEETPQLSRRRLALEKLVSAE